MFYVRLLCVLCACVMWVSCACGKGLRVLCVRVTLIKLALRGIIQHQASIGTSPLFKCDIISCTMQLNIFFIVANSFWSCVVQRCGIDFFSNFNFRT